jgi:CRISPR-associated endonuclease/helicase Cas3
MTFPKFFEAATGHSPYCWQGRLANGEPFESDDPETQTGRPCSSMLIDIPTGLGKTAAVVMAWLWNRVALGREDWPRRLMYCLPMRTLVEQTRDEAREWIHSLIEVNQLPELHSEGRPRIVVLMGGESQDADEREWDIYPEQNCILIGTQDMLLSRALNRGYGMSRYRWPMHFALLNNDALWVMDEVQLMGAGLASTTQLEGFRTQIRFGARQCSSWWMSATIRPDWLRTIDLQDALLQNDPLRLGQEKNKGRIKSLRAASKALFFSGLSSAGNNSKAVAQFILKHRSETGLNLIVVNTVKRARELHAAIAKALPAGFQTPLLIHSQFRPPDRNLVLDAMKFAQPGRMVVATQAIEAGVDLSAHTLFTELAPWSSLVQRFGRCNRWLREGRPQYQDACVYWFDLDEEKDCAPYESTQLSAARERLRLLDRGMKSVAIEHLEAITSPDQDRPLYRHVIRSKDLVELFDTTPDLAGADIDIDRFIRDANDSHVQVFWRDWKGASPNEDNDAGIGLEPGPRREELCSVAFAGKGNASFKDFLSKSGHAFRWNPLDHKWQAVRASEVHPGQVYLLHIRQGGYAEGDGEQLPCGWTGDPKDQPTPFPFQKEISGLRIESYSGEPDSAAPWQTIATHTDAVCSQLEFILQELGNVTHVNHDMDARSIQEALRCAARWHDWGKAHAAFQSMIRRDQMEAAAISGPVAKAPASAWIKGRLPAKPAEQGARRKHFRHELASAIAILHPESVFPVEGFARDLAAFLVAAHHGKVRLSIRSLPDEWVPPRQNDHPLDRRFARGLWDGDRLPCVDMGSGVTANAISSLSLEPMELGLCEHPPFAGQPSWAERALTLRDRLGPFYLAFLESLLRAADARGSNIPAENLEPFQVEETPSGFGAAKSLSESEKELAQAIAAEGLAIQDRFRPEPLYKQTGTGHYDANTVEEIRRARKREQEEKR